MPRGRSKPDANWRTTHPAGARGFGPALTGPPARTGKLHMLGTTFCRDRWR
jgi:hypothetical protein